MGMEKIADRAEWWCLEGNLGYDQGNRWDIRVGGECDCSSLALWCVWEADYMPSQPTWGNTDSMPQQLEALGFKKVAAGKNPPRGVIRLRSGHTAISLGDGRIAQASIDERGKISGGQSGDQANETNVKSDPNNWTWDFYAPDAPVSGAATSPSVVSTYPCKGWTGDEVRKIQQALIAQGYSCGTYGVDGSFGSDTDAAVRRFQQDHGLEVDGIVGKQTQAALFAASSLASSPAYTTGRYVTCVGNLNVRTGAGTGYRRKAKSELTADGQKHSNDAGQLNSGTAVDVSTVSKDSAGSWWGCIPSGWICLYYAPDNKAYATKQ